MTAASQDRKSTRLNSSHANISYAVFCLTRLVPRSTFFPYTTLFRSRTGETASAPRRSGRVWSCSALGRCRHERSHGSLVRERPVIEEEEAAGQRRARRQEAHDGSVPRSEEHTSELQSRQYLVCRLLPDAPRTEIYILSLHDALPI